MRVPVAAGVGKPAHEGLEVKEVTDEPLGKGASDGQIIDIPTAVLMTAQVETAGLGRADHGVRFVSAQGQRFFTHHVFAGGHHLQRQIGMERVALEKRAARLVLRRALVPAQPDQWRLDGSGLIIKQDLVLIIRRAIVFMQR